ncbi:hypothetical protein BHM03_00060179 [Ensete ventricosum]|nr:hypothetical protein BHM03_00060179 [Ensete ventricosum]
MTLPQKSHQIPPRVGHHMGRRNPPLFEARLNHRMQWEPQSRIKGICRQTEATPKSIIRTLLRQGDMEFILQRNEIVLPHLDQSMSCHYRVYIEIGPHRCQGIGGPGVTQSTGRWDDRH